jgi:hypothetical protein
MDASAGKAGVVGGVILCATGMGAVIGIPCILIGLLIMMFGKKPGK